MFVKVSHKIPCNMRKETFLEDKQSEPRRISRGRLARDGLQRKAPKGGL